MQIANAKCKLQLVIARFKKRETGDFHPGKLHFHGAEINPIALLLIVSWDYQANVTSSESSGWFYTTNRCMFGVMYDPRTRDINLP